MQIKDLAEYDEVSTFDLTLSADEPVSKLTATSGSNKLYTVLLLGAFAGGIIWWGKRKENR